MRFSRLASDEVVPLWLFCQQHWPHTRDNRANRNEGDAPRFVEMARAIVAIGATKQLLVACQDCEELFAQIER